MKLTSKISRIAICISVLANILSLISAIGILSNISSVLADNKIGIFAISTYNTDYILVKAENYNRALAALADAGFSIV